MLYNEFTLVNVICHMSLLIWCTLSGQKMLPNQIYQPDRVITVLREELLEDRILEDMIVQLLVGNVQSVSFLSFNC